MSIICFFLNLRHSSIGTYCTLRILQARNLESFETNPKLEERHFYLLCFLLTKRFNREAERKESYVRTKISGKKRNKKMDENKNKNLICNPFLFALHLL